MSSNSQKNKTTFTNKQRKDIIEFKNNNPNTSNIKKHSEDASVDDNIVADAIPKLREVLKEYELKDIYNMEKQTCFIVDNAKYHSSSNLNLHNTTVHYLPPNTTSRIQPLDAGIIMSFKHRYHSYFIKWLLDQYEFEKDDKLNVLNAIKFIVRAWREVLSETVSNCFKHTGILPITQNNKDLALDDNDNNADNDDEKETNEVLNDEEILSLVTNLEPEKIEGDEEEDKSNEEDDNSTEMHQITHHEALSAVEVLEQYLMQQDVGEVAQSNHDQALSNLQKEIRKLRNSTFKQVDIRTFFGSAD
ncbi:523_t:CDS:2 [Gigaspora margarita]|uniref:523_t:CDS:1 n=1 Tax=Gigaspora margarita TaxID=4874 RepID=A0ABN7VA53_GIGMA|nr:523_t:CDS:2 [Gigaspora margarita]